MGMEWVKCKFGLKLNGFLSNYFRLYDASDLLNHCRLSLTPLKRFLLFIVWSLSISSPTFYLFSKTVIYEGALLRGQKLNMKWKLVIGKNFISAKEIV